MLIYKDGVILTGFAKSFISAINYKWDGLNKQLTLLETEEYTD